MKKIIGTIALLCFSIITLNAQIKLPPLDKSPMDMSYYPNQYPQLKLDPKKNTAPLVARVIYSRPQKNGRTIFDSLVAYNKVWRVGANEATEIDFFKPVKINGINIPEGRYTLYAIPDSAKWTIIINKETDIWGDFGYDQNKDILRTDVPVEKQSTSTEALSIVFTKAAAGADLIIVWDTVKVALPIVF
ncbi:MAG: DUF2911 domain-containing protein [Ferruginibacter sp.]